MFHVAAILLALGAPPENAEPERVTTVAVVERLPLAAPIARVVLSVDSLAMRIDVTTTADPRAIYQRFVASDPQLCPFISRAGNTVVLQCRTPRIEARLDPNGGKPVLEIREVRGLPLSEEEATRSGSSTIPSRSTLAVPAQATPLRHAVNVTSRRAASPRPRWNSARPYRANTADWPRFGSATSRCAPAIQQPPRVGTAWPAALAATGAWPWRDCASWAAACLGEMRKRVFDASMLPEPLHGEMLLRAARAHAYIGAVKDSMVNLLEAIRTNPRICDDDTRVSCADAWSCSP
jgi:hypothetical protein